ncbi:MAG: thiosulfate sulfurtransferase GlpE [Oceanospirillaceae bacterium]|nr:thiosulfate sulfurtransferase GlpE [Oceanospirillaceae bacterium]
MADFQCIECDHAKQLLDEGAILLDIRDSQSFDQAHPKLAVNLNNDNLQQLLSPVAKDQAILVLCYHGISSKGAAEFIGSQGFSLVSSINGGFEAWQNLYPQDIISTQ